MGAAIPTPTRVRVLAAPALLQAGLERMVRTAGLEVAPSGDVPVVLRTRDQAWEGGGVDVVVDGSRLSVTMEAAPDPDTWLSVLRLFRTLLDPPPS